MFIRTRHLVVAAAFALAIVPGLYAQVDTGSVLGQVTDSSGAVVPGAQITLQNEGTGSAMTRKSDEKGNYSFSPVQIGTYSIKIDKTGFASMIRSHVSVDIQQGVLLNFILQPGQVQQTVNVSSDLVPMLQTESSSVGQVIQARQINSLPLNGRNYFFLAQLAAGVTFGQSDSRGEDSNGRFAANGVRSTQNNYLLDGMDNNSSIVSRQNGKDFVIQTPVDALSEFKVQTNNYSAEFGRSGGGVLNATVKSGTNSFHGDAWEFIRNDIFDANDYFLKRAGLPLPKLRRNQFGFTEGGPVWIPKIYHGRNKTFFFVDYEGMRLRNGNRMTATVPTVAERNSGFTNFSDLITGQTGTYKDANGVVYPAGTIFDPSTTRLSGKKYVRSPFPGNIIPAGRIDPNAIKILELLPAANLPGIKSNYIVTKDDVDNTNSFDIRIDQNISDTDRLFARYSYNNLERLHSGPFTGYADGGDSESNSDLNDRAQNAIVSETHIFSPHLINDFRIGVNREHALWYLPYGNVPNIPQQFGIMGVPQFAGNGGLPKFNIGSLSNFGAPSSMPSNKYGTTPQLTDDLTYIHGEHSIKTGVEAQRVIYPYYQSPQPRGVFLSSGAYTSVVGQTDGSVGLAQMLLQPTAANPLAGASQLKLANAAWQNLIRNYFGAYIQDDWKALHGLTLNIGLRYDFYSFPHDRKGLIANFQPGPGRVGGAYLVTPQAAPLLPNQFVNALGAEGIQVQQVGEEVGNAQKLNFAPRLGFAYLMTKRLVVRGGYGISYGGIEDFGGGNLPTQNFPLQYSITYTNADPQTPLSKDGSLGSLETSFANMSLNPSTIDPSGLQLNSMQRNWQTSYTQSQNLMVQYQVTGSTSLTVGYVGSTTRHIITQAGFNEPRELLPPGATTINYVPYPTTALTGDTAVTTNGIGNYNSFQTTIEKQESHGLSLLANFTWAKTLTDARDPLENDIGGYRAVYLPNFGIGKDLALADFNTPFIFHFSGIYDLPFGPGRSFASGTHGIAKAIVAGWNLNWIAAVQGGQPFTIPCAITTSTGFGCFALKVPGVDPYAHSSVAHFVNAAAFASPPVVETIGQSDYSPLGGPPTQASGPPYRRLDVSVFKRFNLAEGVYSEFRASAFNVTNTASFSSPGSLKYTNLTTFGQINSLRGSPRELQFAIKLYW